MDLITLKNAEKAYQKSTTIEEWLKHFSIFVWNKIGYTRAKKLKIFETTVTQELVFRLCLAMDKHSGWGIDMYESQDENANGNDLEIIIRTKCGYLKLPCQAKIIYNTARTDTYKAIKHPIKIKDSSGVITQDEQINTLIAYADKIGGRPIYLFYNFCGNAKKLKKLKELKPELDLASLGCSFARADKIKEKYCKTDSSTGKTIWKIPTFEDLHVGVALSFYKLIPFAKSFCTLIHGDSSFDKKPIKFYSIEEIENENEDWTHIEETKLYKENYLFDDLIASYALKMPNKNSESQPFNPAHRIILNSQANPFQEKLK